VLHFPHGRIKNFKKGHRLVVLPDYQGLGIGHAFSTYIAQMYKDKGFRFIITSSTKSLFKQRQKDKRWAITHHGKVSEHEGILKGSGASNKLTFSYEYIGEQNNKIQHNKK
jgi:GNAT superfamily N-acetyltransferase